LTHVRTLRPPNRTQFVHMAVKDKGYQSHFQGKLKLDFCPPISASRFLF
jgi:hypothetical protein